MRNPMYVGVMLVLVGESLAFRSMRILVYSAIVCGCRGAVTACCGSGPASGWRQADPMRDNGVEC